MSTICSKIESIDRLWFEPFSAKAVKVVKACAVDTTIVAIGEDGKIYTNGVIKRIAYSCHGDEGKISRVLDGCIKLGVLSASAVRQHKSDVAARAKKREMRWAADQIEDYANRLGISFTDEQLDEIAKAKGKQ
jgi:hypothetical protein